MRGAIKKTKNFFSNSCAKNLAITNKNIISGETGKIAFGGAAADCKDGEGRDEEKARKMFRENDIKNRRKKTKTNGVKNI